MSDLAEDAAGRFRDGDLQGSLASITGAVKNSPADVRLRVFLCQLLMVQGSWDRALNQLKVVGELDASAIPMMHSYTAAILCERVREDVFKGDRSPLVLGEPPSWVATQLRSLQRFAKGEFDEAQDLREQAWEDAPELCGEIDGAAFSWLADSDSRIGPVFEVLLEGSYYWVPIERVREVRLEPPVDTRDLVWLPADFVWENGGNAMGFIPSRYPGAAGLGDSFALSRQTEWKDEAGEFVVGSGQRVWATGEEDYSMFEVRRIQIEV